MALLAKSCETAGLTSKWPGRDPQDLGGAFLRSYPLTLDAFDSTRDETVEMR